MEAAAKALPAWSAKTAYERAALLKKAADLIRERAADLARTTVMEAGKPIAAGQRGMGRGGRPVRMVCRRGQARLWPMGARTKRGQASTGDPAAGGRGRLDHRLEFSRL